MCTLIRGSIRNLRSTPNCLDESLSDLEEVISPLYANYTSCIAINNSFFLKSEAQFINTDKNTIEKAYRNSTATYIQNAKTVPEKLQVDHSKDQVTKSL